MITVALLHKFVYEFRGNNTYIILDRTALLLTLWSCFDIDHSPAERISTRCAICVYLQDKWWVRKRFLLFFSATVINAMSELELRKLNFHAINQFRVVEISQLLLEQNKCWALFRVIAVIRFSIKEQKSVIRLVKISQLLLKQNKCWTLIKVITVNRLH